MALPEVVVSGSRQEQASDDLPVSIDVIGAEQISSGQSTSLREAVRDLPNVSVQTSPARFSVGGTTASALRDGNTGLNIRGLGGNRVLMLVDGIRIPRSYAFRTTTFDREDVKYKKSVLPTGVPRIAVEMGATDGWWKYGCAAVVGIDTYGESAPAPVLFKHFGFTEENVAATVLAALKRK